MAWRRSDDKPLSEPMVVNLLTHICVTRSLWVIERLGRHHTFRRKSSSCIQMSSQRLKCHCFYPQFVTDCIGTYDDIFVSVMLLVQWKRRVFRRTTIAVEAHLCELIYFDFNEGFSKFVINDKSQYQLNNLPKGLIPVRSINNDMSHGYDAHLCQPNRIKALDKMGDICRRHFNCLFILWYKFQWISFLKVHLTLIPHWSR